MLHSIILSFLISFLAMNPGKDLPKVTITLCNIQTPKVSTGLTDTSGKTTLDAFPITAKALSECGTVNVNVDMGAGKEYKDAKIVSYAIVYSPKSKSNPPFVHLCFNEEVPESMREHFKSAKAGDIVVLGNIQIAIKNGTEIVNGRGSSYIVTD